MYTESSIQYPVPNSVCCELYTGFSTGYWVLYEILNTVNGKLDSVSYTDFHVSSNFYGECTDEFAALIDCTFDCDCATVTLHDVFYYG